MIKGFINCVRIGVLSTVLATPAITLAQTPEPVEKVYQCRGSKSYAQDFGGRQTFLWRPEWLEAISADTERRKDAIDEAEKALERGPYSVTNKSKFVPGAWLSG